MDTSINSEYNSQMKVGIIGLGLIGGSLAISLRKNGFSSQIFSSFFSEEESKIALEKGLVNAVLAFEEICSTCDIIILATPVKSIQKMLPKVLDLIPDHAVVTDVGSTKKTICETVSMHPKRDQFVAAHPIAGTENSGPNAAVDGLFNGKLNIICEAEKSDKLALNNVVELFESVGMHTTFRDADEHDRQLAYVSHLSHVSSFMLGLTVLNMEKNEENIFNLAGSGFESTVRLAKSSPEMWSSIFAQNKSNILDALGSYIENLNAFYQLIEKDKTTETKELMIAANEVRRILK